MTGVTFIVSHQGRVFKDLLSSRVYLYYWLPKKEVLGQGYLLLLVAGVTFISGYEYEGKDTYFIYYSKDGMGRFRFIWGTGGHLSRYRMLSLSDSRMRYSHHHQ